MSKAEERALEKYPLMADDDKEGLEALKYIGMECGCASEYNEVQEAKQAYFIEGYHQAEKDLELNWENVRELCKLSVFVEVDLGRLVSDERHYTEVLKRFKSYGKKEI